MKSLTLKESILVSEGRHPDKTYTPHYAKSIVDKVTVELAGNDAGTWSKIGRKYYRLQEAIKIFQLRHKELNKEIREKIVDLFDAEDVYVTRIVNTAKFTLMLYAQARPDPKAEPEKTTDHEAVVTDLLKLLEGDLLKKAEELIAAHTKIKKTNSEKSPNLKVSPRLTADSEIKEGLADKWTALKSWARGILKSMASWAIAYDKKLSKLQETFEKNANDPIMGPKHKK